MSWVHIDDVIDLIYYALTNDNVEGPINATAPNPLRNKDFTAVLGNVLNRPYLFTVPKTIIDLALGEMGQLITRGQYVLPKKAKEYGYNFHYPHLNEARSEEHTSELQSRGHLVCRLLLEKKKK